MTENKNTIKNVIKNITMEREKYNITLKMTSTGNWYIGSFEIPCDSITEGIELADIAMTKVHEILNKHNKKEVTKRLKN